MQLRLVDFNYPMQDATTVSASSQDVEFPATNLQDPFRSRVWRSSGYFIVTAGVNDKINFKETGGGAERTGTIAAGSYSPTTLAAAIKAAMEGAAGATGIYTVSYGSTTGKWTIATSLAFLSLLSNTGTNLATSIWATIGFSTAADQTGAVTYTGSQIAIHTEERVTFDLVTAEDIDSFALLFDPIAGMNLSSTAVVHLQGNATNVWTAPSVDQAVAVDSTYEVAAYFFSVVQQYRFWSVKIVDPHNADLFVELGAVVLGKATQLTYLPANEFQHTLMDTSKYQETPYGHRYVDVQPLRKKIALDYKALPYSDIQLLETAFRRVGKGTPVLLAFDPTAEFYNKDHFLLYAYFDSDLDQKHIIGPNFSQGFKFLEAF
jgi:hypothetical protein